jgi:hypothetical protein
MAKPSSAILRLRRDYDDLDVRLARLEGFLLTSGAEVSEPPQNGVREALTALEERFTAAERRHTELRREVKRINAPRWR